jgi:hypothetical protein
MNLAPCPSAAPRSRAASARLRATAARSCATAARSCATAARSCATAARSCATAARSCATAARSCATAARSCATAARSCATTALLPGLALLGLALLAPGGRAGADDRNLFRASSTSPLVMTILDSSASMQLRPDGSFAPAGADDPNSRFYQAKAALYEVIEALGGDLVYGWAHFNQEGMEVLHKRWLYAGELINGDASSRFAPTGGPISFGPRPSALSVGSCAVPLVADSMEDVELFPKLGDGSALFVELQGSQLIFFFTLDPSLGAETPTLSYTIRTNPGCGMGVGDDPVTFELQLSPYYTADNDGNAFESGRGFDYLQYSEAIDTPFGHAVKDYEVDSACRSNDSWMANENGATSDSSFSSPDGRPSSDGDPALYYDNSAPPSGPTCSSQGDPFVRGDIVPFDWVNRIDASVEGWEVGAKEEILRRLNPNRAFGGPDDFRIARYFQNTPSGGRLELAPAPVGSLFAADRYPPILTGLGTPLAGVLDDLYDYFQEFAECAEDEVEGDERFPCRQRYLILVTDGAESCIDPLTGDPDGAVAEAARKLHEDLGFKIFVIGFGADVDAGVLRTLADAGGTGTEDADNDGNVDCEELSTATFDFCPGPQVAADKLQLVAALGRAFGAVQPNPSAAFAAATAPEVTAETEDSIFLSSFVPVDDANTNPGKLFHFIRPLPLRQDASGRFVADENEICSDDEDLSCLAWEADAVMRGSGGFDQVPSVTQAKNGTHLLGGGTGERRLFYAQEPGTAGTVKLPTRLLTPPTSGSVAELDLLFGMGLPLADAARIPNIVTGVVAEKTAVSPLDPADVFTYILPDFFHSSPRLAGAPARAEYLIQNLPAGSSLDCNTSKGYRCFFEKHRYRRKVLLAGGSDAQLHAFDAGTFDSQVTGGLQVGTFNRGTGQEIFAYVPRALLPRLVDFEIPDGAEEPSSPSHKFGVDNPVRLDDVFIDPAHTGSPTANDREWRTVAFGTLREGGRSVFALDVTQPDPLTTAGGEQVPQANDYVPSCMEFTSYSSSDCGPVAYGSVLWEFEDQYDAAGALCAGGTGCVGTLADDDADGQPDLGNTWSVPNTGRVRISVGGATVDRYVAIFGGGIDCLVGPGLGCQGGSDASVGAWLYMVDVETGKALYKRRLDGPAPSTPAAVDTNRDGVLDTIYIGTLAGSMYKVDLSAVPTLTNGRVTSTFWNPARFFTTCDLASRPGTNDPLVAPAVGCPPIFLPPSVFFAQQAGANFALAFGTGDRSDLWNPSRATEVGRFYEIVDSNFVASELPRIAADYPAETAASLNDFSGNPLFDFGGYVLELGAGEKLVSEPFVLGGITVFSTFVPSDQQVVAEQQLCFFNGVSNLYSIFTATGNAVSSTGGSSRYRSAEGLVSNPFTETSGRAGEGDGEDGGQDTEDEVDPDLERIRNELKSFFPPNCRFTSVSIDIKALRSDTGIEFIAPVPVCVVEKNWREF